MKLFSCPKCDYTTNKSINSLRIHYTKRKHGTAEELWQILFNHGQPITCKCGCGESTKFLGVVKGYAEWKRGHVSRVKNNWGHNEKAVGASIKKRRQMFKDGKLEVWNKGLTAESDERVALIAKKMNTPERGHKISKALKGSSKSASHRQKIKAHMQAYWSDPTHKEEQRQRRIKYMQSPGKWQCYGVCHRVEHEGQEWFLKSNYELQAYNYFCQQSDIKQLKYEPLQIRCANGQVYLPDFVLTMNDKSQRIVEIKSEFYANDPTWKEKEMSAYHFAGENSYTFEVWTEKTHPFLARSSSQLIITDSGG